LAFFRAGAGQFPKPASGEARRTKRKYFSLRRLRRRNEK